MAWGYNGSGQGVVPAGLTHVLAIAAGGNHNLAVTTIPLIKIATQPQNLITNLGATANFQVSANCQVSLSYQWQKNGANIAGATGAALTLPNAQASDAGTYAVVLSHPSLTITSSPATLTFASPVIVTQPNNVLVSAGNPGSFAVSATGSSPLAYQWTKNGTNLVGQTGPNLIIGSVQLTDGGSYSVVVTNAFGSVTSAPAILTLLPTLYAVSPPATVVSLGGPVVPSGLDDVVAIAAGYGQQLAVRSNGTVVCWGNTISGSPQPPASLSNVVAVASGGIHSVALKRDGTVVGWGLQATPPSGLFGVIAIASGHDHTLALKADGTTVTWGGFNAAPPLGNTNYTAVAAGSSFSAGLRNDGTVPGGISGVFGFNGASNMIAIAANGSSGLVMLRNDGTVSSWNVPVPAGLSNVVAVSPGLALRSDGTVVGLGSTAPAGLTNVTAISGAMGNGLVLTRWPVITQPPQSQAVDANSPAAFSVVAAGAPTLSYQWRKNGVNLDGATNSSLSLSNVHPADAGIYDVIVSNGAGSIASTAATLTVNSFPGIATPPKSQILLVGMKVDFTVAATGAQPLNYQWQHNGIEMGGANGANLSLNNVQMSDGGNYAVVVSNGSGSVTSAPAALTVISNAFVLPPPGTVVGLGGPVVPPGLTNAIAIAAGYGQQLAVRGDGTVICWGHTIFGTPQPPPDLSNVVAVSSGGIHSIALKRDGTVVGWGHDATPPSGLFGVVGIASGHDHTLALKADGTTVTWGGANITPPPGNANYVAVAAGLSFSAGLRNDGTVPGGILGVFGFNGASNVTALAASGLDGLVMLRNDGTVSGWDVPVPAGLSNVVAVSAGLALRNDGTVVGLGATVPAGLTNVTAICGAVGNGLVLTTNPPPPVLAGASAGGGFILSTPVSVPGYVLESSASPSGPYTIVEAYTNAMTSETLSLPASAPKQYYRLRKP
jgi:alpha-tubulin suppressor-like RCC1 family protein